jgi:uncharacterized protein (DUF1778 family)
MSKKTKVIHCRVTEAEHKAIAEAAMAKGVSITRFVVLTVLAKTQAPAD